jgi:peroxiredoxin
MRTAVVDTGPNIGQLAPEIDLLDGNGERWMLSGARGRVVALFFYPADESPICTKQMCGVRDNWLRYLQSGAEVVGVNTDSMERHRRFVAKHKLPIRLLSDSACKKWHRDAAAARCTGRARASRNGRVAAALNVAGRVYFTVTSGSVR